MANVVAKITGAGNADVMVTERGVSFGYNTLVSDMRALPILARTTGAPVIFDATHSVQQPGGRGGTSGGERIRAGAGARGGRRRRRRRVHRDPPGSGPGPVGRTQHGSLEGHGGIAAPADGVRPGGERREAMTIAAWGRPAAPVTARRVLAVAAFANFTSSLFMRAIDPLAPQVAIDMSTDPATVALLTTAFALPYAVLQPVLGHWPT